MASSPLHLLEAKPSTKRVGAVAQLALAASLFASIFPAGSAAAVAESTAQPGSVQIVPDAGVALHVPADGRINSDGIAAEVNGYRFANQVGFGASTVRAARGQRLLVFGLTGAPRPSSDGSPSPTAVLSVDGNQEQLPAPANEGSGPTFYLASIPTASKQVQLQLSSQGFMQAFSFTSGTRVGLQPPVLYRSQDDWEVTDQVGQTVSLASPDPQSANTDSETDITLNSASLTWFGPDAATDYPANPGMTWLVLDASSQADPGGERLSYASTLAGSQVTVSLPGDPNPIPASMTAQGGPNDESASHAGILGGVYYFQVPETVTTATVTFTPGTISATPVVYLQAPSPVQVTGSAVFNLSFPPPWQPPPPSPGDPPAYATSTNGATLTASRGGGSGGFPFVLVALPLVILLAGASFLIARRARQQASAPSTAAAHGADPDSEPIPDSHQAPSAGHPSSNGAASSPLLAPPAGPPEPPDGVVRVNVFGAPGVSAWPADQPLPGQTVLELLVLLVLHPGQCFTTEELQSRLGEGRKTDLDLGTIRRYVNELRRALGDERIPEIRPGAGYEALGVTSDAAELNRSFELACKATDPAERARQLAEGLSLVRAAPFAGAPKGCYGWAVNDSTIAHAMGKLILRVAVDLADLAVESGDAALATWAAEKGLVVWPTDDALLGYLLSGAALDGLSPLRATREQIKARLTNHDCEITESLESHYQRLCHDLQQRAKEPEQS